MKNKHAVALGRRNKGVPKTLTPEQRADRADLMRAISLEYNAKIAAGIITRKVRGKGKKKKRIKSLSAV